MSVTEGGDKTNLPAGVSGDFLAKLKSGLAHTRATHVSAGGKPFLRLLKDNRWVHGQNDIEVQEGSSWAINIASMAHGWCCWPKNDDGGPNKMLGEVLGPAWEPRAAQPAPIGENGFTVQVAFEIRCLDGEDMGVEALYKNNSYGGRDAFDELIAKVQAQLEKNPNHPCPVVHLDSTYYDHKSYGRIYKPVFTIVDWCDFRGMLESESTALPQPTQPKSQQATASTASPDPVASPAKREPVRSRATAGAPEQPQKRAPIGPKPGKETPRAGRPAPDAPAPTARRRPVRR